MSRRSTRLFAPALLIAACAAILAFAATASAETRTGESASAVSEGTASPETTILNAGASYDTTAGSFRFNMTTAAEPQVTSKNLISVLLDTAPECNAGPEALTAAVFSGGKLVLLSGRYSESAVPAIELDLAGLFGGGIGGEGIVGLGTKAVAGTTTTISVTSPRLTEGTYNCAVGIVAEEVETTKKEQEEIEKEEEEVRHGEKAKVEKEGAKPKGESYIAVPLKGQPAPPAQPATAAPAPASPPAPPALSIAKPKPLKLKVGKSKTVKLKVTNTGATASAQGSLRLKPVKGILVKPETQKVPPLAAGASWTVSFQVQVTKKAKASSKLSLIGTAPGVSAKGSLVVKLEK
jgi:NPCBM-associated, NEW3 domain of alpha-galactosidase